MPLRCRGIRISGPFASGLPGLLDAARRALSPVDDRGASRTMNRAPLRSGFSQHLPRGQPFLDVVPSLPPHWQNAWASGLLSPWTMSSAQRQKPRRRSFLNTHFPVCPFHNNRILHKNATALLLATARRLHLVPLDALDWGRTTARPSPTRPLARSFGQLC